VWATQHGTENVPIAGAAVLAAEHAGRAGSDLVALLGLVGPRRVHVLAEPQSVRTCLQLLAEQQAIAILAQGTPGVVEQARFHRRAAYLALVAGAPVVPVMLFEGQPPDIVYGAPYRVAAQPWPRTKKLVAATSLDLSIHVLVARDAAGRLTGWLTGPGPTGSRPGSPDPGGTP
jgi:1-acyl-sn-glycerol-3-phosphate acyltransferase